MNIIKSICVLSKAKKPNQLCLLLKSSLLIFISKSTSSNPQLSSFLSNFSQFKPILDTYPSTDIELHPQESNSTLNKDRDILDKESNFFPLKTKKKSSLIQDSIRCSLDSTNSLEFSEQEVRKLLKVFSLLNSKKIKILILLMENNETNIRKLAVILFQILLNKSSSKIHFVEKCALGYVPGLYCLTRLKYLQNKGATGEDIIMLISHIRNYVKAKLTQIHLKGDSLQGKIFLHRVHQINLKRLFLVLRI